MNNDGFIGVFDSGLGGLTVAKTIIEELPAENIIYFGDTAHVPYGTKSPKQIREFAINDVNFLRRFDLKALVIACNTADSVARQTLEEKFDLPIYGVIQPASKRAAKLTANGNIGIMATRATVSSQAYNRAILNVNPSAHVHSIACPLLVPLVENGRFSKDDPVTRLVLQEYLVPLLEKGIDTLVLGCTHYPLLSEAIEDLAKGVRVISSSEAAAFALKNGLAKAGLLRSGGIGVHRYYVSDDAEHFKENAMLFMGNEIAGEVGQVNV